MISLDFLLDTDEELIHFYFLFSSPLLFFVNVMWSLIKLLYLFFLLGLQFDNYIPFCNTIYSFLDLSKKFSMLLANFFTSSYFFPLILILLLLFKGIVYFLACFLRE